MSFATVDTVKLAWRALAARDDIESLLVESQHRAEVLLSEWANAVVALADERDARTTAELQEWRTMEAVRRLEAIVAKQSQQLAAMEENAAAHAEDLGATAAALDAAQLLATVTSDPTVAPATVDAAQRWLATHG